jgi:hypothetical protein
MQVFYLSDPKLVDSWKVTQALNNKDTYYNPTVVKEDNESDDQGANNDLY